MSHVPNCFETLCPVQNSKQFVQLIWMLWINEISRDFSITCVLGGYPILHKDPVIIFDVNIICYGKLVICDRSNLIGIQKYEVAQPTYILHQSSMGIQLIWWKFCCFDRNATRLMWYFGYSHENKWQYIIMSSYVNTMTNVITIGNEINDCN